MKFIRAISRVVISATILFPLTVGAADVHQEATITINPDSSAQGTWTIPIDTADTDTFLFSNFQKFGMTGSFKYKVTDIRNEHGKLELSDFGGDNVIVNTKYQSGTGVKPMYIDYSIKTIFKSPLALYEFWVANGGYFMSPELTISYPKDWKIISVWPKPENTQSNPIKIHYPLDTSYVYPVEIVFLPPGQTNTYKEVDRYKTAGSPETIKKVSSAVQKLDFLPKLISDRLGVSMPENVVLLTKDMSSVDIGYEAEALAVRPNVIILNDYFVKTKDVKELAVLIAHEITHLTEFQQQIFKNAPYVAAWFREGLATAIENEARSQIYPSEFEKATFDLTSNSRFMTPLQLSESYKKDFDLTFDGSNYFGLNISYKRAGTAMLHVIQTLGGQGMKKLFDSLKKSDTAQLCYECDSETIFSSISSLSDLDKGDILRPFKDSSNFSTLVRPFTRKEYSSDVAVDVYRRYLSTKAKRYFSTGTSQPQPEVEDEALRDLKKDNPTPVLKATSTPETKEKKQFELSTSSPEVLATKPEDHGEITHSFTDDAPSFAPDRPTEEVKEVEQTWWDTIKNFFRNLF